MHLGTVEGWYTLNVAAMEARDLRQGKKLCERPCPHLLGDDVVLEEAIEIYVKLTDLLIAAGRCCESAAGITCIHR